MDMASGKVYFWDSNTDEVAWEPPAGTQPRSKQETADTFAEHLSANSTPPNTQVAATPQTSASPGAMAADAPDDATAANDAVAVVRDRHAESASSESSVEDVGAAESPATKRQQLASDIDGAEVPAATIQQVGSSHEDGEVNTAELTGGSLTADKATSSAAHTSAQADNNLPVSAIQPTPAADAVATHAVLAAPPSTEVAALGAQTAQQVQAALLAFCQGVPQLVRLAVEAEVRLQDWQMFAGKQQCAADQGLPSEVLSWQDFQDHVQWRWRSIAAAIPDAVAQAQELRVRSSSVCRGHSEPPCNQQHRHGHMLECRFTSWSSCYKQLDTTWVGIALILPSKPMPHLLSD